MSKLQIVWKTACACHIIHEGFPLLHGVVGGHALNPDCDLELRTRRAHRLGQFWLSPTAIPRLALSFSASQGMPVSEIRFIPANYDWLISVSTGIWSVITCWDVHPRASRTAVKLAEWSPRGAIFTGIAVNQHRQSDAVLAVSTNVAESVGL